MKQYDILFMTDWKISTSNWSTVSEGRLKGGGKGRGQGRGNRYGAESRSREAQGRRPRNGSEEGRPPTQGGPGVRSRLRGSAANQKAPSICLDTATHGHKIVSLWLRRHGSRKGPGERGEKGRGRRSPFVPQGHIGCMHILSHGFTCTPAP